MTDSRPRARVLYVGLGGTIAMTRTDTGGITPVLGADALIAAVPGLAELPVSVESRNLAQVPGASLTIDTIARVAAELAAELDTGRYAGAVITQGTDTLEETAYLLSLLHRTDHPLVVTGAMRAPSLAGADGPANLLAAVTAAADPQLRGLGPLIVFNDQILDPARTRKTHSTSTAAFTADTGPLGHIVEGRVRFLARPLPRIVHAQPFTRPATVGLLTLSLGDDGEMLRAAQGRFDGLVVSAFGAGHVPGGHVELLQKEAARIPVVLASRTGAGPVLSHTYAFPGSESDLLARGLIGAGYLDPYKARILLTVLLRTGADLGAVRAAFDPSAVEL
ncbi:asparaginase [Kitasatospora sp. MBT63]|uniref:asparaginase n=1 Tax=Kitasatospora sp. MBT63 TaxID=1444768 RepID=UPI00068BD80F|nr:asparaginase [Kitasatospora sp. MBT63]